MMNIIDGVPCCYMQSQKITKARIGFVSQYSKPTACVSLVNVAHFSPPLLPTKDRLFPSKAWAAAESYLYSRIEDIIPTKFPKQRVHCENHRDLQ